MPTYARTQILMGAYHASDPDNSNMAYLFIPAGKEVDVFDAQVMIEGKSDAAGANVEFVNIVTDDLYCSGAVGGTNGGTNNTNAQMTVDGTNATAFPFTIASSTSDRMFGLRIDDAGTSGIYGAMVRHSAIDLD